MDDQLGEDAVKFTVRVWQLLCGGLLHLHAGVPFADGGDEGLRGVNRRHGVHSQPPHQFPGKGSRPAPDVEHLLIRTDPGEVGELGASGPEYRPIKRS